MISRIDIEDMTDAQDELDKALALIRENSAAPSAPWTGEEFTHSLMPDDMCAAVATILNAAVSADLARPSQSGDDRVDELMAFARPFADALDIECDFMTPPAPFEDGFDARARARAAIAAMDTPKGGGDE